MDIQVAFQGGGARLALLLPIVDSLLTLERAGEIRINATAGTSAGAVAAALVAGNANMDKLRTLLKTRCQTDSDSIRKILPPSSWPKIAQLLLFKWPFANEEDLATFLEECLREAGLRPGLSVKQLGRPFFASIADLTDRTVKPYSEDTIVKQALMNSTAVPFWYKCGERGLMAAYLTICRSIISI